MKTERRVSYIENFLSKLLTAAFGSSECVFVGTLPPTTDSDWEYMVYADVQKMTDMTAYTTGSVLIYLYARPSGTPARKNVTLLNKMEKKVYAAIEDSDDEDYAIKVQWTNTDYDDDRNFHYNVISIKVIAR